MKLFMICTVAQSTIAGNIMAAIDEDCGGKYTFEKGYWLSASGNLPATHYGFKAIIMPVNLEDIRFLRMARRLKDLEQAGRANADTAASQLRAFIINEINTRPLKIPIPTLAQCRAFVVALIQLANIEGENISEKLASLGLRVIRIIT